MRTMADGKISTVDSGEDDLGSPLRVSVREMRRARNWRRLVLLLLVAFLILGALNVFGVHTDTVSATGGGYELQVHYPRTARPGVGAPLSIEVRHPSGFDGPVTLSMTKDYFDILAQYSFDPDPSKATQSDKAITWEFDPPPGETFSVSVSTEFSPDEHPGAHDATVTVIDEDKPAVSAKFRTWEWP
jgi:hypothetical protein